MRAAWLCLLLTACPAPKRTQPDTIKHTTEPGRCAHRFSVEDYGLAECVGPAKTWNEAPSEDFECSVDADCALITGMCFEASVNQAAAPRFQVIPCNDPRSGACPPFEGRAVCDQGCCTTRTD